MADRGAVVVETARARMVVRAKATDSMRRGHVALPHGYGQRHPTAEGTRQVSGNIVGVTDAATQTGVAASQVLGAAGELSRNSEALRSQVLRFLSEIRAA